MGAGSILDLKLWTGRRSRACPVPAARFTNRSGGLVNSRIVLIGTPYRLSWSPAPMATNLPFASCPTDALKEQSQLEKGQPRLTA